MSLRVLVLAALLIAACSMSSLRSQPAPPPLQPYSVRPDQVPRVAFDAVEKRFECRGDVMRQRVTAFRVSPTMAIWEIPCDLFAYNASSVFLLVPVAQPDKFRFLAFQAPPGRTRDDPYTLINPKWDARARTVASFTKGRGIGDCGSYEVHELVGDEFRLVEFREKEDCDGKATPPERYKLVYRAR